MTVKSKNETVLLSPEYSKKLIFFIRPFYMCLACYEFSMTSSMLCRFHTRSQNVKVTEVAYQPLPAIFQSVKGSVLYKSKEYTFLVNT